MTDDLRLSIPRSALGRLAISENGFVFDPATGNSFMCNETALAILLKLKQSENTSQLLEELEKEYQVSDRELERDLLEFTGQLRKNLGI